MQNVHIYKSCKLLPHFNKELSKRYQLASHEAK